VAGLDLDREAQRCFRLSRITGKVRLVGPEDAYTIPDDVDVLAFASEAEAQPQGWRRRRCGVSSREPR
jgi:proteasome accessory factor B